MPSDGGFLVGIRYSLKFTGWYKVGLELGAKSYCLLDLQGW